MAKVIGVFSGKGGVGKTTLVANLSAALADVFNKNVVVFDSNLHSSHLGLHFGLYEDLPVTLKEVLKRRMSIMQAVYIHPTTGVRIIPAPLNGEDLNLTKGKCCSLVNKIKNNYDVVILDCAPGLGKEVLIPMQSVDEAIVVSTADIAAVTDAMKTIELLKRFKKKVLGLVINRHTYQKYELTPEEISSTTNYNVIKVVPEDSKVPDSISKGLPAVISYPHSKASIAFKQLAASLVNVPYKESNIWERIRGMLNLKLPAFSKSESKLPNGQIIKKEIPDLVELRDDLVDDVKEKIKSELMKRVKERLKEKMA